MVAPTRRVRGHRFGRDRLKSEDQPGFAQRLQQFGVVWRRSPAATITTIGLTWRVRALRPPLGRLDDQPSVGAVQQRAPANREAGGLPFETQVGMLEAEDVKERSPARSWDPRIEGDP
jgi:hypothetical protein